MMSILFGLVALARSQSTLSDCIKYNELYLLNKNAIIPNLD